MVFVHRALQYLRRCRGRVLAVGGLALLLLTLAAAPVQTPSVPVPAAAPALLPTVIPALPPTATPTATAAVALPPFPHAEVDAILAAAGGTFGGIVFDQTSATQVYTRNATRIFPAASLIKLPIALALYEQAQQGALNLDERLTLREQDKVGGTGSIQHAPAGTTYSLRDLCARMLADSDNTAANMLTRRLGGFAPVNSLLDRLGARQTRMQRYLMDMDAIRAGRDNLTSAADMALLLRVLARGEVVGAAGAQELLSALAQTVDRRKIPALLPPEATVSHKIGALPGVEHDAAIIDIPPAASSPPAPDESPPPPRRAIVVLLSQGLPNNQAGIDAIARAAQRIYTYEQQLSE